MRSPRWLALCWLAVAAPLLSWGQCNNWQSLNEAANKAVKGLNYELAERSYKDAIQSAQQSGCDSNRLALSAVSLADVYKYQGKYRESEDLFRQVRTLIPKIQNRYQGLEATLLNNLADLYLELARYDEAVRLAIDSIDIRKREFGRKHPAYAVSVDTLGEAYLGQGRIAEAEPLFREALSVTSKKGSEWARGGSENGLARILMNQGKFTEAEMMATRSVTDEETAYGVRHPQVAGALVVLASVYRASGRYADAMSACERALAIDKSLSKSDHLSTATALHELAEAYMAQKMYSEAEPLYKQALEMRRNLLPADNPDYRQTLTAYQKLLQEIGGGKSSQPQN